jgi:drug/metabolite transporter (DMT)-like permease
VGLAFVGIRSAGKTFSPAALSLGRLLAGAVLLLGITAVRGELRPPRGELLAAAPAFLLCGLLWFAAYSVALNAGERRVDAGTAAMLIGVARSSSRPSPACSCARAFRGRCSPVAPSPSAASP